MCWLLFGVSGVVRCLLPVVCGLLVDAGCALRVACWLPSVAYGLCLVVSCLICVVWRVMGVACCIAVVLLIARC